jgi:CheY-like chemotaxis protein
MPRKIFIADDETALRYLLRETLIDEDYEVTEAEDGEEAIVKLREDQYDLVILDYMMPGHTGVEVCEWLRQNNNPNQTKPVILLTAKVQEQDRQRAKQADVTAYITKPFSPLQLLDTIEELIVGKSKG